MSFVNEELSFELGLKMVANVKLKLWIPGQRTYELHRAGRTLFSGHSIAVLDAMRVSYYDEAYSGAVWYGLFLFLKSTPRTDVRVKR